MKTLKKSLAFLVIAVLMVSLSVSAFADNFVTSPTNTGGVSVVEATDANGNKVNFEFTGAKDATGDIKAALDACISFLKTADLSNLNAEFVEAWAGNKTQVGSVFDVSFDEGTAFPVTFKFSVKSDIAQKFAGVGHFVNGAVEALEASIEGDVVTATSNGASPFVVFVYADEAASPATGETLPYGFFAGALVLACAAAFFFVKSRKA